MKDIKLLTLEDVRLNPIWKYCDGGSGTEVEPVEEYPVNDLAGRIVATNVHLANSQTVPALLGNIILGDSGLTKHFLTLSVFNEGVWFTLARYHDFDYDRCGPNALAKFLNLPLNSVFPITYDISQVVASKSEAVSGHLSAEPECRLTRDELISLAIKS